MQQVYITADRLKSLRKDQRELEHVQAACHCKISLGADEVITLAGDDAYGEFVAESILRAYGRGFELKTAMLLLGEDYYFEVLDLGQLLGNDKRVQRIKARVIGESGRTKKYIESVSGVRISVYGDTVGFIGSHTQIEEAKAAVGTLVEGGTHKLAYMRMEAAHRRNKTAAHTPIL